MRMTGAGAAHCLALPKNPTLPKSLALPMKP